VAVPKAVLQVFLMPIPAPIPGARGDEKDAHPDGRQLAVVNLSGDFADGHPAGIEAETLTVLSICATLHANLPQIAGVRFLVNGQPRDTLAGHADLTRTYLTAETSAAASGTAADANAAGENKP
jgi:hypothetical protein